MRPNVEFRVDLPKTNLGLTKSHLQRHVATRTKNAPDRESKHSQVFYTLGELLETLTIVGESDNWRRVISTSTILWAP